MPPRISQARPEKTDRSRATNRALLLGGILLLWMAGLVVQLYHLQIIEYGDLLARARRQQQHMIEVAPKRGEIFDRQMNPLAMSLAVDSVFAVPSEIPDPKMVSDLLAPVLGLDANDLLGRITNSHSFCWVKRKTSPEEANRVRDLNLKGIYFQRESKRFYPKGDLAAHILGYVGLDDKGLAGLEYGMDSVIRGRPGRVLLATDARRRSFQSTEWAGKPGKNLVLTLDEKIQYITEKALAEAVEKWKAAGGAAIVQNPNTGEILAMASQPTYDPNDFAKSPPEALQDRGLSWVYEPGSTFKLVTVSAVLEEKLANPDEVVNCQQGSIVLAGHVIHDHKSFANLTVRDVVVESSDVGAIKLGLRLGEQRLYKYIRSFGFGEKTEVELPGEERGLLKPPSSWSGISIGEISMGQEIGVTPIQLVTTYSAVANGGVLFEPRLIHDLFLGAGTRRHASRSRSPGDQRADGKCHEGNSCGRGGKRNRPGCATRRLLIRREDGHSAENRSFRRLFKIALCSVFCRVCSLRKTGGNHSGGYRLTGGSNLRGRSGSPGVQVHRRADSGLFERSARQPLPMASTCLLNLRRDSGPETRRPCGTPSQGL